MIWVPAGFEHFFRELAELLAADSPDLTQITGLAERYGLQFGPPDWVSDLVSAYGLTPPS